MAPFKEEISFRGLAPGLVINFDKLKAAFVMLSKYLEYQIIFVVNENPQPNFILSDIKLFLKRKQMEERPIKMLNEKRTH
jgi:hypothetical protein